MVLLFFARPSAINPRGTDEPKAIPADARRNGALRTADLRMWEQLELLDDNEQLDTGGHPVHSRHHFLDVHDDDHLDHAVDRRLRLEQRQSGDRRVQTDHPVADQAARRREEETGGRLRKGRQRRHSAVKTAAREVCEEVVNTSAVPSGAAKEAALASCKK